MHCILFQCLYWCLFSAWNVHVLIYHYDSRVLQIYMYYPLRHKKAILSITDCLNKIKSVSTDTSDRLYIWDYCIHQFDPCGLWLKWGYSQNFLRKLKGAVLFKICVTYSPRNAVVVSMYVCVCASVLHFQILQEEAFVGLTFITWSTCQSVWKTGDLSGHTVVFPLSLWMVIY